VQGVRHADRHDVEVVAREQRLEVADVVRYREALDERLAPRVLQSRQGHDLDVGARRVPEQVLLARVAEPDDADPQRWLGRPVAVPGVAGGPVGHVVVLLVDAGPAGTARAAYCPGARTFIVTAATCAELHDGGLVSCSDVPSLPTGARKRTSTDREHQRRADRRRS
jgi:hypothetical protein